MLWSPYRWRLTSNIISSYQISFERGKGKRKKKPGYMMTWDFGFNLITLAFYISWTHNYFGKNWLILDKYNTTKLHQNYFLWASQPMRAKLRTISSNRAVFHDVTELVLQFMKTWVFYSPSLKSTFQIISLTLDTGLKSRKFYSLMLLWIHEVLWNFKIFA